MRSTGAAAHVIALPEHTLVCLHGEIDIGTTATLETALRDAERTPSSDIVVDLGNVEFMDSAGLRVLVDQRDRLAAHARQLTIRRPRPAVSRLIAVAGGL